MFEANLTLFGPISILSLFEGAEKPFILYCFLFRVIIVVN
jgi:hypothetical protein